ncbi:hypothetical protein [Burkholderia sp. BCC1644]|uniref:hypothetical protein n=1 Tax=Burkholderia sp. BCC1644 TaxID=2676293 RepID=UPI001ABAF774|nr:hypothetical protein [Burkholderia sp. BCC1644]
MTVLLFRIEARKIVRTTPLDRRSMQAAAAGRRAVSRRQNIDSKSTIDYRGYERRASSNGISILPIAINTLDLPGFFLGNTATASLEKKNFPDFDCLY